MNPYEHLKAKLKHAHGLDAKFVRCDIEELASVLEELETLRGCVKASAFQDGYNKAVDDFKKALYHEAKWDSGCWIRFKMVENVADQLKRGGKND